MIWSSEAESALEAPCVSPFVVSSSSCGRRRRDLARRRHVQRGGVPTRRRSRRISARITVERLNVVDANGTLRLVIANKDRMHPGVMDGKTIDRPRPVAGLIFFNDEGDEVGGLTYTGQEREGVRRADAGLMFDQLKQDQTIEASVTRSPRAGKTAGFQVWDRADTSPRGDVIEQLNAANKIQDRAARDAAVAKVRASAPPGRGACSSARTRMALRPSR